MAITGTQSGVNAPSLNLNVGDYATAVGELQGNYVTKNEYISDTMNRSSTMSGDTVQAADGGAYKLKGKAGIAPTFYKDFSDAFDSYKKVIVADLKKLETNPNITQAFKGYDIEKSIKNLIIAVEEEAKDYLFKLEQREKTVIQSVESAFSRQQQAMGMSMKKDTMRLKDGNSSQADINKFNTQAKGWYQG